MNSIGEILCKYVEYNDLENVQKLLDQGKMLFHFNFMLKIINNNQNYRRKSNTNFTLWKNGSRNCLRE